MIRITYISAIDGKASTIQFKTHDRAVAEWNNLIASGYLFAATMSSGSTSAKIMRAYASARFTKATDRATWAN